MGILAIFVAKPIFKCLWYKLRNELKIYIRER